MYARTKGWELGEVTVAVDYDNRSTPRRFEVAIKLGGELSEEQLERLEKVARSCPLRRSIEAGDRVRRDHRARRRATGRALGGNRRCIVSRKQIVILGGGTGGTMTANRLRRRFDPDEAEIHVVDRDDRHVYQPGLLFVPFGLAHVDEIVRPRRRQLRGGVVFHQNEVEEVWTERDEVLLDDGTVLPYDVLVVASGVRLQPEETEGMTGAGWNERVFTFYNPEGAEALHGALERFDGGRLVVNLVDMPIKCPVAPLEFAFLADWYLRERGIRNRTELVYATPLDGAFTKPIASQHLAGLLAEKEIELVTEFNAGEVDGVGGTLTSYDGRELDFDLLVTVPLHGGAAYVERSPGLGDALGFVPTDKRTLQTPVKPNVFALGDATDLPTSKAGSVTHFEAEVLTENIARYLADEELDAGYDGHANCFIETGFHKALLIDFNYDTEPLPGHFPTAFGLPLLRESRLNHLGKLAFQWVYWHALLPGREIPGIGPTMPTAGKKHDRGSHLRGERDDHDPDRRCPGRRRRRRLPHRPRAVERADRRGDRARQRHPGADRPALARRPLHARALPRHRHRPLDPLARQGIRRPDQGALPALPQGARQARRQDRRHPQAQGLHLERSPP